MNKFLLYLVMLPSRFWSSLGADAEQLRAILDTRLKLDDRKPLSIMRGQKQKKDRKFGSVVSAVIMAVLGAMYIFPLWLIPDRVFSLTIYFTVLLVVITFMLITDFSNVLFDSRDKFILFPRPVNDRTIVLARMLHVFIYLIRLVVPLALPGWISLGIRDGWQSALLFPLPLVLLMFIALFLVNLVYLLVLRLSKPEKFKDVINYFQIITSVIFFASIYLPQVLFNKRTIVTPPAITDYPWVKYLPTYWLATCWRWIGAPLGLAGTSFYSVFAIALPLLCMYIMIRRLAPEFSRRIAGIDAVEGSAAVIIKTSSGSRFYEKLANTFNTTTTARAGFILTWLHSARSRSFKMRVYPNFAFIPIYFVFLILRAGDSVTESFQRMTHKQSISLYFLYMCSFVMVNAMNYVTISDQYKAAWVYYSTPVETPGRLMVGALKAIWVKYFLPFYILVSIFVVYMWGLSSLMDVVLALVNITLFVACIARINYRHLPFSMMEQMKQRGARIIKSVITMFIPVIMGFGHFFSMHLLWLKILFLILSSIMLWLVWDSYANTTWENVIREELE